MANIKSAKKRIGVIAKKTEQNKVRKSVVKSSIKRFEEAIEAKDVQLATERLTFVEKKLMKAANKNTIHKNAASRKVARLAKKLNALKAAN